MAPPVDTKPPLTARQQEALDWMGRVGKASEKLIRENGYAPRTFQTLARLGLVQRDTIPGRAAPVPFYRARRDPS